MNELHIKVIEHLYISFMALALGSSISLPLGILLSYNKRLSKFVVGIASILQTIPSLALLAIMVPIFGVGKLPAIIALSIYSLLPILRSTIQGIESVSENTIDAAKGMGMSELQILRNVKLPLASNIILSGIRLSATYVLVWTTIASFIGAGGMGDLIFSGLNNYDIKLIVVGTLSITGLTLVVDTAFNYLTKVLTPRTSSKAVKL